MIDYVRNRVLTLLKVKGLVKTKLATVPATLLWRFTCIKMFECLQYIFHQLFKMSK